jgi:hypothetical protein
MNAKGASLVRSGGDDASFSVASYDNGLSSQLRLIK